MEARVNWRTKGWVAREERAGGGSSIRVGIAAEKGENHSTMLNIFQSNKGKMDEAKKKGAGAGNAR